jgi:VCBS repeat-containing protein
MIDNSNTGLVVATLLDAAPNIDTMLRLEFQADANGTAFITIEARDQSNETVTDILEVVVNAVNDAPTPVDDATDTTEDAQITTFNVLFNSPVDTDPDGDMLTVVGINGTSSLIGTSANGAIVTMNVNNVQGALNYDPTAADALQALAENQTLVDTFTYTVSDGNLQTEATVSITVTGVNDGPVAVNDQATTDKNVTTDIFVLSNDTDDEGDNLFVTKVNGVVAPIGQTVQLTSDAMVTRNADNSLTYDPFGSFDSLNSGESAIDSFTYTIDDGHNEPASAFVTVTILGPNTPPIAVDDTPTTDEETSITINVLANDSDPDGQAISLASIDTSNTRGNVVINGNSVIYNPNDQFEALAIGETGSDTFTYKVVDTQGGEAVGTVTVSIRGVNDPPIGVDDGYNVIQGSRLTTIDPDGSLTPTNILDDGLLANDIDIDGDTLIANKLADPLNGTLIVNSDGTFAYTHDGGPSSSDVFTYEVSDGNGGVDTVMVNLTIVPRPTSPWQNPDNRFDVNGDGFVTPIDALLVINRLNTNGPGPLPVPIVQPNAPPPFYDVNGDIALSSIDVLQVINELNTTVVGEGEASPNPELLAEGEGNQILALPTSTAHYGAALWSHVTQDQLIAPAPQPGASASAHALQSGSANSLLATVQAHQQAVAIDQAFAHGLFGDSDDDELVDGDDAGWNPDLFHDLENELLDLPE